MPGEINEINVAFLPTHFVTYYLPPGNNLITSTWMDCGPTTLKKLHSKGNTQSEEEGNITNQMSLFSISTSRLCLASVQVDQAERRDFPV